MWRQVVAQSPGENAPSAEILRYDVGWKALNTMLKAGRSLSGHERNCCFLNTRGERFADISAAADLDFSDDGRVLALTDWDFDGDLDFWIANRTGPQVRFLRNDATQGQKYVAFRLEGVRCNRDAIGAKVELHVGDREHPVRVKTLRAGEGYLAQSSKWLIFGLGDIEQIDHAVVRWPDGSRETIRDLKPGTRYRIRQGQESAQPWAPPTRDVQLAASKVEEPASTDKARIVLISPLPMPNIEYQSTESQRAVSLAGGGSPRLINLWASWCQPCIKELGEWSQEAERFRAAGLDVIAVNVDELDESGKKEQEIRDMIGALKLPFASGFSSLKLKNQFDVLQRSILRRQQPLPVPSSFLVDARGNLRVIYKGPVDAEQVLRDSKLLDASEKEIVEASVPYEGIWLGTPSGSSPNQLAVRFVEGGFVDEAEAYLQQLAGNPTRNRLYNPAEAMVLLGAIYTDRKQYASAAEALKRALDADPNHRQSHIVLAEVLTKLNRHSEAAEHYEAALERRENDPELRLKLALARISLGQYEEAAAELRKSIAYRPSPIAWHHLGNSLVALGQLPKAVECFEEAIRMAPDLRVSVNNLAWLLATRPAILQPTRAVELAMRLVETTEQKNAGDLDTLAAAQAAAGEFAAAISTSEAAIHAATSAGDTAKADRISKRRALYQQRRPYQE